MARKCLRHPGRGTQLEAGKNLSSGPRAEVPSGDPSGTKAAVWLLAFCLRHFLIVAQHESQPGRRHLPRRPFAGQTPR